MNSFALSPKYTIKAGNVIVVIVDWLFISVCSRNTIMTIGVAYHGLKCLFPYTIQYCFWWGIWIWPGPRVIIAGVCLTLSIPKSDKIKYLSSCEFEHLVFDATHFRSKVKIWGQKSIICPV